jgi:hypothetical protein
MVSVRGDRKAMLEIRIFEKMDGPSAFFPVFDLSQGPLDNDPL